LYTTKDAERCFPLFSPVRYDETIPIGDGIDVSFYDAGHVLGSAMIKVHVNQDGQQRSVLFSGDVGRPNRPILRDPTLFRSVDYVVTESTYGDRLHDDSEDIDDTLAEVVNSTRQAGGNLIIPSFALERSQELLYHLNQLLLEDRIPHLMVFVDSPMAISVTEVFERHPEMFDEQMLQLVRRNESPFQFPGLTMTRTTAESKAINHIKGTVIVIAGSGMCTGGRIKHHLVNNIARPESTILFVGYQAVGTLGRQILDGAEEVRILGQMHPVRARIARISGFSGHADRAELFRWLSSLQKRPRGVFVVHGEPEAAQSFAEYLAAKTDWPVTIPDYKTEVVLD